jgi:hypothetical protein
MVENTIGTMPRRCKVVQSLEVCAKHRAWMDEVMRAPAYYDVPPGGTIVKSSVEVSAKPDLSFAWQEFICPAEWCSSSRRPTLKKKKADKKGKGTKKGEGTRSVPPPLLRQ